MPNVLCAFSGPYVKAIFEAPFQMPFNIPWKLKPGFINRVLVAVIFGGLEMPLEIVFLEPQNWRPLKPHY